MTHNHGPIPLDRAGTGAADVPAADDKAQPGHGHSMWWMVACCAPMVLLALAILFGVFGPQ